MVWYDLGGLRWVTHPVGSASMTTSQTSARASRSASPPSGPSMPVHRSLTPLGTSYGSGVAWAVRSSMEYLDAAASIDAGSRPPRALASSSSYAVALPTWSGTAAGSSGGTSAGRGDAGSSGGAGDVDGSSSVASFVVVVGSDVGAG